MDQPQPRDPALMGRPVFFVRPHSVVQKELIDALINNEYEVAVLSDHSRVRDLLRLHPQAIAFLNIDEGYSEPEWEALVREIQDDPETGQARIGVLTYHPDVEVSHKYLLDLQIPCGYVKLTLGLEDSTQTILKVLEANEAKGRRQFLRVPCRDGAASLNFKIGERNYTGQVLDLSSVGFACIIDPDTRFAARSHVKGIQLKLRGILCQISAVVMGSRARDDGSTIYVLLFDRTVHDDIKEKIRKFMGKTLQAKLESDLEA